MSHAARTTTDAVIEALTDADLVVGDGVKPDAGGWQGVPEQSDFVGYVTVHSLSGGVTRGPIEGINDDAEAPYQFSAVGHTRAQCEAMSDLAREAVLNASLTVDGKSVILVTVDMLGGARRDDIEQPPVWLAVDRYRVFTTPD